MALFIVLVELAIRADIHVREVYIESQRGSNSTPFAFDFEPLYTFAKRTLIAHHSDDLSTILHVAHVCDLYHKSRRQGDVLAFDKELDATIDAEARKDRERIEALVKKAQEKASCPVDHPAIRYKTVVLQHRQAQD